MDKEFQVSVTIESPGGVSALVTNMTEAEHEFLLRLADDMSKANPLHASPYINVERID